MRLLLHKIFKQIIKKPPVGTIEGFVNWFDTLLGLPDWTFALGIDINIFVRWEISGLRPITGSKWSNSEDRPSFGLKDAFPLPVSWSASMGEWIYLLLCSFHLIAPELQYVSSFHRKKLPVCYLQYRMEFIAIKKILIVIARFFSRQNEWKDMRTEQIHYKHQR